MKADLLRRVKKMEQENNPMDSLTILVKSFAEGALSGYLFRKGKEEVEVRRKAGETDEDLKERAVALAREHTGNNWGTVITEIRDDDHEQ